MIKPDLSNELPGAPPQSKEADIKSLSSESASDSPPATQTQSQSMLAVDWRKWLNHLLVYIVVLIFYKCLSRLALYSGLLSESMYKKLPEHWQWDG